MEISRTKRRGGRAKDHLGPIQSPSRYIPGRRQRQNKEEKAQDMENNKLRARLIQNIHVYLNIYL
jgi:hypothetical protein